jgi:hypothetical protein
VRHQALVDAIRSNDVGAIQHQLTHHGGTRFL